MKNRPGAGDAKLSQEVLGSGSINDFELTEPGPNRALPPWALNVLREGVKHKHPDPRKVWGQVVSIAMSCRRRGWTEVQFTEEIWSQETRIYPGGERIYGYWRLMTQLLTTVKGNKSRAQRQIARAWATAGDNLLRHDGTPKTFEDYMAGVLEAAWAWDDRLDEDLDNLSVTRKLVMRYVTSSVVKRRNSKVTCPSREVGAAACVPRMTANRVLRSLAHDGFLVLHDRGIHSEDPKKWRSAIYSLSDPFSLPYGGTNATEVGHREPLGSTPMSQGVIGPTERPRHWALERQEPKHTREHTDT